MTSSEITTDTEKQISFEDFRNEVLNDFYIASLSRCLSVAGRKEVLTGKAKFRIFDDGKEIAQIVMAKNFRNGDWRSGYYCDQTFMLAAGMLSPEQFFAQLYGNTNIKHNPHNSGPLFNNHFSTANINSDGTWKNLVSQKNSAADLSHAAGQMPRLAGLAWASKLFRENPKLSSFANFSDHGNEVAFGTIGDASTSEGHFWETINAAGVLHVPMALFIWDDGYEIPVPKKYQTAKQSISELLRGLEKDNNGGILIYKTKGWDYAGMVTTFKEGIARCRKEHIPVIFHAEEMTQPLVHSTSGFHEHCKTPERIAWEDEFDPIKKMRNWLIENKITSPDELDKIQERALNDTENAKQKAWNNFTEPIKRECDELIRIIDNRSCVCKREHIDKIGIITNELKKIVNPIRKDIFSSAKKILRHVCIDCTIREKLQNDLHLWLSRNYADARNRYSSHLYIQTERSAIKIKSVAPIFNDNSAIVDGCEVLRNNWDYLFNKYPLLVVFGEDVGHIGCVNESFEGLQKKYGELRISDTGIRETTILGQGIGLALRGLRPVVKIQYFDNLLYALQTLSDDLASLHYRTAGRQKAPVIISAQRYRLEGIWHSGSPLSMVINFIRGIYVAVPRNMTQSAGFYNTLLEADDPALVIEHCNGYRLKEKLPENIGEYKIPFGVPEILITGDDLTLVTYGSCVCIAQDAIEQLKEFGIKVELIDVQTLLPFDVNKIILESIKKTNKIVFFDKDIPGGATAYMMQQILEVQGAYQYLDAEPITITAQEHHPAYTTDGDYFSNPNAEDLFERIYDIMHKYNPGKYPQIY